MEKIFCKCGYVGNQMIQYETETPSKQLMDLKSEVIGNIYENPELLNSEVK